MNKYKYVRRYNINYVRSGMILANPVSLPTGAIIAMENTVLDDNIIRRLKTADISYVDLVEQTDEDMGGISDLQRFVYQKHNEITGTVKDIFQQARYFKTIPVEQIAELSDKSIPLLVKTPGVLNILQMIQDKDNYTFNHSVHVAVICGILGRWINYGNTNELVMAGLLHDIGKTQIPLEVLNKPDKLTEPEMQIMKLHTTLGWEMCKDNNQIPKHILRGIIEHHERLDGSGYPHRKSGDDISLFGRIIAIADLYHAMTSNRVYRRAMTPFHVLRELFSEMFGKLDPAMCTLFISNIRETLVGYTVALNDGTQAKVIHIDAKRQVKPVVQTLDGQYIDLESTNLDIVEIITS